MAELCRDDVCRLACDTRKLHEVLEPSGDPAVELLEQDPHRAADRLRLLTKEPGGIDVPLELLLRDCEVVLGGSVLLEEDGRDTVDVRVRRLRREHDRDEKLEIGPEAQRDRSVGVLARETSDDRLDSLASSTQPSASRFADVAARHAQLFRWPS